MISDADKRNAWATLGDRIARGLVPWPDYLSQEQIDYLTTSISRAAHSGETGRELRSIIRWWQLSEAFEILKAKHPEKSDRQVYEGLADHYGCGWSTVRKARQYCKKRKMTYADRANMPGASKVDLAAFDLRHINFDKFPAE